VRKKGIKYIKRFLVQSTRYGVVAQPVKSSFGFGEHTAEDRGVVDSKMLSAWKVPPAPLFFLFKL